MKSSLWIVIPWLLALVHVEGMWTFTYASSHDCVRSVLENLNPLLPHTSDIAIGDYVEIAFKNPYNGDAIQHRHGIYNGPGPNGGAFRFTDGSVPQSWITEAKVFKKGDYVQITFVNPYNGNSIEHRRGVYKGLSADGTAFQFIDGGLPRTWITDVKHVTE